MSKINDLINKLCPDGVEYKTLSSITKTLKKGTLKTTDLVTNGKYPVINSGREIYGYYNDFNNEGNAITFAARGEYAGIVNYFESKFWAGGLSYPYMSSNEKILNTKYLYYYLKSKEKHIMENLVARGSIPALNKSDLDKYKVAVPPLEVQCEIVHILDNFTLLSAELSAELKARKKQYEYYRNHLLKNVDDAKTIQLHKLFDLKNGYTPSKSNKEFWENGTIPWFRMEDIRQNGRILNDSIQHITSKAIKGKLFPANSIIVSTSATIGEHALIKVESLSNQRFTYLVLKDEYKNSVNINYLYYYCFLLDKYCLNNVNQGNFASVDMSAFKKFEFIIPPLNEQLKIVTILEKFDKLCHDISEGLPAEIDARQKQYEYYRDKLLTFKELKVNE